MWNSHSRQRTCWIAILPNCLIRDAAWWYPGSTRAASLSGKQVDQMANNSRDNPKQAASNNL